MSRSALTGCIWMVAVSAMSAQAVEPPTSTPAAAAEPASPLHRLWIDFAHLGTRDSLLVLGTGVGVSLLVHPRDRAVTTWASSSEPLDEVLDGGAAMGGGSVQIGGALATYLMGRLMHHPRVVSAGSDLIQAQLVSGAVTEGLKFAIDRRRPDGGRYSLPSGHSSSAFATAAVLEHELGWKAGAAAYAAAAYVATSRLSENEHFVSDVVLGAAIGIASSHAVTVGRHGSGPSLLPFVGRHNAGVALRWTPSQ